MMTLQMVAAVVFIVLFVFLSGCVIWKNIKRNPRGW